MCKAKQPRTQVHFALHGNHDCNDVLAGIAGYRQNDLRLVGLWLVAAVGARARLKFFAQLARSSGPHRPEEKQGWHCKS
jgi:hypothetical protein